LSARPVSTTVDGGTLLIGSAAASASAVAIFEFTADSTIGIIDGAGGSYRVPYQPDRWYYITFDIDWEDQTLDFYVNANLVEQEVPFRGTDVGAVTGLYFYNQSDTTSFWDDVLLLDVSPLERLAVTPAVI